MKPTMIDLFAGCGGLSSGFSKAGYEVVGFVENWKPAITTFLKNHPNANLIGTDITRISDETILKYKGIEIIAGGPPCQGFSICGKRDKKDKRNQLYKHFIRFVSIIKPKIAVFENVPGILSMRDYDNEKIINKIIHEFIRIGYSVSYKILLASDYGVPQDRYRLILIAVKSSFPKPSGEKINVFEALSGLPKKEISLNGHVCFNPSRETISRIRKLNQGENLSKFNCSPYRLFADKPSRTIVTKPIYIHPFYDRLLTPRELARLQSFPDNFEFSGTKTAMVKQIGNAVPPLMAYAIAENLKGVLL